MKVTGSSNKRVSLAALMCMRPGQRPRLIYRVHHARQRGMDRRKGFTEAVYAQLLDAAHQQHALERAPERRQAAPPAVRHLELSSR